MGLKAIIGLRGESQAFCTCEDCGAEQVVPARHGTSGPFVKGGPNAWTLHSEATVVASLGKLGWSNVKNRLRCKKCTELRNEKKQEAAMVTVTTPARKMTPEMELDIMEALFASYDRKAKRYTKGDTDSTVAEAVGGGCMPGWVAKIRAEKFGPAGNEDSEKFRSDLSNVNSALSQMLTAAANDLQQQLNKFVADHAAEHKRIIGEMQARLNAIYKAEDKRVK